MEDKKYKIRRIEANWYVDGTGVERFLTYDTEQNCQSIEEQDGYMYVNLEGERHRFPLSVINLTVFETVKQEETN